MKAVILGAGGQLGRALIATAPAGMMVAALDSAALDITDAEAVRVRITGAAPDLIVNAAAYTAVDRAETDEARAQAVNGDAVATLTDVARATGARLVQVSTDFVFDGRSGTPYHPDARTGPLNAYGRTKLFGEQAAGDDALIVRTAWVYATQGGNFVRTMLRLMAAQPLLRVVADQVGTPTYAPDLARTIWTLAGQGARGVHHATDSGIASWYDFAVAIQEEALALGLLERVADVVPIATADFPTPAVRPAFSVLDKSATWDACGGAGVHWRVNLRRMLKDVAAHG